MWGSMLVERKYVCEDCGFVAEDGRGLASHRRGRHGAVKRELSKRGKDVVRIMQGEIEVKLVCAFCGKDFIRRTWFDNHGDKCLAREKIERRFGKHKHLPKVAHLRPWYFLHDGAYITFMSSKMNRAEAEVEFIAEVAAITARGRRPAQVLTASSVVAEMIESGYMRG